MAIMLPRNPTVLESLQQALQIGLPGVIQGAQGRATTQFGQQLGLNIPSGTPPQLAQQLILAQMQQQPQDPFTLGQGQQRFTPTGQPIASVPAAVKRETETQFRAREGRRIQAIPPEQRTAKEQARLEELFKKGALVEIGFGKPASAAERTKIAETRASIDALDNLKTLFDSVQTKTGIIAGRLEPIKGLFGLTTEKQEDFLAATSAFRNSMIREITGAQMSEPEAKRILKQVPQETDPPVRWLAKWRQSKKNLKFLQKRRAEILRQSGLRVPTESQQPLIIDNPQTGQSLQSFDGGKTWQPIQ